MSKSIILTDQFEINKASELCQVFFLKKTDNKKYELFDINATQLDILNIIFYRSNEILIRNKIDISASDTTMVELNFMDFSQILSKYKNSEYTKLVEYLEDLLELKVVINALNKNKNIQKMTITRFILSITVSKHLDTNKKVIEIMMDNKVLAKVHNIKSLFAKMFLKIQFSMVSKYSKLLYELLKDYSRINKKTIDLNILYDLMNVTEENMRTWSRFRAHILMKAIQEINDKSDIIVDFEPIKEKLENQRLQVTKIIFDIKEQPEDRLIELGILEQKIECNKFYSKSKSKLDQLVKNGYKVTDEEMWIETDIKKNEDRYESEDRIDTWLNETDPSDKTVIYEKIAAYLDSCEDPMVVIDNYKLIGLFSRDAFTRNPQETIKMMNTVIQMDTVDEE